MLLVSGSERPSSGRGGSRQAYYCIADANYRDPKILRFLQDVVKGIDAAILAPRPSEDEEEPSSVILEEIEAPGPAPKGPLPRPRPPSEQSEHDEAQCMAPMAEAGAAPAPTDGVSGAWGVVEKALNEVRVLYKSSRATEDAALASLEAFLQCHGEAGRQQAGKWVQMAHGRREEIAAAAEAWAARERRRNLEKIGEARLARTRALMEKARRARERAEGVARRALKEAQRRLQEEERLRTELAGEWPAPAGAGDQALPRCYMCGEPGVKKSRNCPNHKGRRTR